MIIMIANFASVHRERERARVTYRLPLPLLPNEFQRGGINGPKFTLPKDTPGCCPRPLTNLKGLLMLPEASFHKILKTIRLLS